MHRRNGSRSPHGERGLKYKNFKTLVETKSRSPHGERGLKYLKAADESLKIAVALLTESVD